MSESTPPPPPPSSGSSPTGPVGGARSNPLAGLHNHDVAQMGLALLVLIASLLPFYTYSFGAISVGLNAWHGFFGWLGVLLAVGAGGVLAAHLFARVVVPSLRTTVLGLFAAAAVCLVLALVVTPEPDLTGTGLSSGHGFGYWLALLCVLGATALALMRKAARD